MTLCFNGKGMRKSLIYVILIESQGVFLNKSALLFNK